MHQKPKAFCKYSSFQLTHYVCKSGTHPERWRAIRRAIRLNAAFRIRDMSTARALPAAPPASDEGIRRSMMSNRRTDTIPEVSMRSMLHRAGLRFRKDHYIKLEPRGVKVDVVFPSAKVAVFIDGCFWHRCPEHATMPKRNSEYWSAKFERNIERDLENTENLHRLGWLVIRIWEHEVKHAELADHALNRVVHAVRHRFAANRG